MKVVAIISEQESLETIAPNRENALEYLKNQILEGYKNDEYFHVTLFYNNIQLNHSWYGDENFCFLECDLNHMYDNPINITAELLIVFKEFLIQNNLMFENFTQL